MPPPSIPSLRPHRDEPAARINTPSSGAAALCTHHPTRPSPRPGCRQSAAGATPRRRIGRVLPRGHRWAGHRRGRRGAHALSSRCVPIVSKVLTYLCTMCCDPTHQRLSPHEPQAAPLCPPRLQPSAAAGCSPLPPQPAPLCPPSLQPSAPPGCSPLLPQPAALCCPRLHPSAAPGCSPLPPHQARASAEAALQQLAHALRALRATWAGALQC